MNSTQLQYFLVLAQKHSYSEAADMLFVTQPTLSRNIIALEEEIGATLFSRDKNGTRLTPAGQAFYEGIRPLTLRYDTLLESVRSIQSGLAGTLTISITADQTMPISILDAVSAFHTLYPSVDIRFTQCETFELPTKLQEGAIDFGILVDFGGPHLEHVSTISLAEEIPCLVVSQNSVYADRTELAPTDLFSILSEYRLILPAPSALGHEYAEPMAKFQEMLHLESPSFRVKYVEDMRALPLYVGAGLGVTISNRSHVIAQDPRLKMLEIPHGERYHKIAWYKTDSKNPVLDSFLDYLSSNGILSSSVSTNT